MTDIHKLHIDLSDWLAPALSTYAEIAEILKHTKESFLYNTDCGACNMVINQYLKQNQHTIESLERRIAELEREK